MHDRFEHTPPLLVWYGAAQPTVNPALYGAQVRRLTRTVDQRLCADAAAATAGFVCNTPAGADGNAYKTLLTSIQAVWKCNLMRLYLLRVTPRSASFLSVGPAAIHALFLRPFSHEIFQPLSYLSVLSCLFVSYY